MFWKDQVDAGDDKNRAVTHAESLRFRRQLPGDVASDEHRLQVDPQILHQHPLLQNLRRVDQLVDPELYVLLERRVVSAITRTSYVAVRCSRVRKNLLLSSELMIIKLSSKAAIISPVSVPFSNSSPRLLKDENDNCTMAQSTMTCFSFASISLSLIALMHMSCAGGRTLSMRGRIFLKIRA